MRTFDNTNDKYLSQFENIEYLWDESKSAKEIEAAVLGISADESLSKAMRKARSFEYIAKNAPVAVDTEDIFQDKLYGGGLISAQRARWIKEVGEKYLKKERELIYGFYEPCKILHVHDDFGHTSPNTELLLKIGIGGIYERLEEFKADKNENSLFVIASHAYEFEVKNDWEKIEKILAYLHSDEKIIVLPLRDAVRHIFSKM